jgi:hypothetical protein
MKYNKPRLNDFNVWPGRTGASRIRFGLQVLGSGRRVARRGRRLLRARDLARERC